MKALVMLKPCGCVWGIETRTSRNAVTRFRLAAEQSGRTLATMDHDEARARLFVCAHGEDPVHG